MAPFLLEMFRDNRQQKKLEVTAYTISFETFENSKRCAVGFQNTFGSYYLTKKLI
jgi:hypothetical protein